MSGLTRHFWGRIRAVDGLRPFSDAATNRLSVAHVTTVDESLYFLLLNQLQSVRGAGFQVTAVSSPGSHRILIEAAGIRHISVPMSRRILTPLGDLRSLVRLYQVFRRERFTIVHTHTPKAGVLGRLAAMLAGTPVVVHTNHGFVFNDRSPIPSRLLFMALEKIAGACSDLIFTINEEDLVTALRYKIGPARVLRSIGPGGIGTDLKRFDPTLLTGADRIAKRLEVGLPPGGPVVGCVARLVREKGWLELFAAAQGIREIVPDVHFLFVGAVDEEKGDAISPEDARTYGINDISHFIGARDDMPDLYALMDVFVLPSHREGFPRTPMEASAMGVPCVVTDIRGSREVVEHQHTGLVVPVGDIEALVRAIVLILQNSALARSMGEEARRRALAQFDEQKVFQTVLHEYHRLLLEKGLPLPIPLEAVG